MVVSMFDKLFGSVDLLNRGLGAAWTRNKVLQNNIANSDTPGFKASQVEFRDIIQAKSSEGSFQMKASNTRHITAASAGGQGVIIRQNENISYSMDENSVDVEAEMASLARNSLHYNTMIRKINSEFTKLRMAVRGQ